MTQSMTGYARVDCSTPEASMVWELRSVNHRYLDVVLRLPDELRALEVQARERLGKRLGRGKVDGILRYKPLKNVDGKLALDETVLKQLSAACAQITQTLRETQPVNPLDVLAWPGVVEQPEADPEALKTAVMQGLDEAVAQLVEARKAEGERLAGVLRERIGDIQRLLSELRDALPAISQRWRERLQKRLDELEAEPDSGRLEQEMVILATRMDVDEELTRLDSHVTALHEALVQKKPAGRRLDFLIQECNREANTIGSKAQGIESTNAAVDLKVIIEQMREQVQNIE